MIWLPPAQAGDLCHSYMLLPINKKLVKTPKDPQYLYTILLPTTSLQHSDKYYHSEVGYNLLTIETVSKRHVHAAGAAMQC